MERMVSIQSSSRDTNKQQKQKQQQQKTKNKKKKGGKRNFQYYFIFLFLIFVFVVFIDQPEFNKYSIQLSSSTFTRKGNNALSSKNPHHETIDDIDVLWASPPPTFPSSRHNNHPPPCGILFVAHGCQHSHTDWFTDCEDCLGLPEELAIVDIAMKRNLLVVAISSKNRRKKCWNEKIDGPRVGRVLKQFQSRFQPYYKDVPIYAFGASSGGSFVSRLGKYIQIEGFISQISAKKEPHPTDCVVYLTMNRDERTDLAAKEIIRHTKKVSKHIRLQPLAITSDSFFSNRISDISTEQSMNIVQSLRNHSYLDPLGYLSQDPRRSNWRSVVRQFAGNDTLIADESKLSEVMNVAFGYHELTRDGVQEGLDYCLQLQKRSHGSSGENCNI